MTTEAGKGRNVRYTIEGCDNSHDWRQPFDAEYFIVNGERRSNPKICRACLAGENSVWAESPCDRAFESSSSVSASSKEPPNQGAERVSSK